MKGFDQQVADWARTKPADEAYVYESASQCAVCQFLRETGLASNPSVRPGAWRDKDAANPEQRYRFSARLEDAVASSPWTFGALADRLSA